MADPSLAPAGKHVASILFQYAPYRLRETTQEEAIGLALGALTD